MGSSSNPHYASMCHLRRLVPTDSLGGTEPSNDIASLILLDNHVKFGRSETCDVVLTSTHGIKNGTSTNMISREHALITGIKAPNGKIERYMITDHSLNGTYINDYRCRTNEPQIVKEGDIIKFGHMNGASVKEGTHAPQANAEFAFVMEKANPQIEYLGFRDGRRAKALVCRGEKHYCEETEIPRKLSTMSSGPPSVLQMTPTTIPNSTAQMMNLFPFPYGMNPLTASIYGPQFLQNSVTSGFRAPNIFAPFPNTYPGLPATTAANVFNRNFLGPQPSPQLINQLLTNNQMQGMVSGATEALIQQSAGTATSKEQVRQVPEKQIEKPAVASPPMECDSSVPSPPKATAPAKPSPKPKEDEEPSERSYPTSPIQTRIPEWNNRANSPDSDVVRESEDKTPVEPEKQQEVKKEPATSTSTVKPGKIRKNNELAHLIADVTETSFVNQLKKAPSSSRRMTEEERVEKQAKKEKKKKNKAMGSRPPTTPSSSFTGTPGRARMLRQLSDEDSVTSDSDSDDPPRPRKADPPPPPPPLPPKKRKMKSSESEEDSDSDDSTKKKKKKGKGKKVSLPKKSPSPWMRKGPHPKNRWNPRNDDASSASSVDEAPVPASQGMMVDVGEPCAMGSKCKIQLKGTGTIEWVACDGCDKWFHNYCALGHNRPLEEEDDSFFCGCKKGEKKGRK